MRITIICIVCSVAFIFGTSTLLASSATVPFVSFEQANTLPGVIAEITLPEIESPGWLKAEEAAAARQQAIIAAPKPPPRTHTPTAPSMTISYNIETRGAIWANLAEFRQKAYETLNDSRGWSRLGVSFQEVATGGQFSLVLSEAAHLPGFSSGCSADYSCRVGRYVVINQDRWLGATSAWNQAGGSLRDYQHMVVNHETGHWLGHSHAYCRGAGQLAPVMQQQSMSLQGCQFNPWPLANELRAPNIGR